MASPSVAQSVVPSRELSIDAVAQALNMLAITGQFHLLVTTPAFDTGDRRPIGPSKRPPLAVQVKFTSPIDSNDHSNP
jgi:hypothetical protein